MLAIDILNAIEKDKPDYIIDLHIVNSRVVGFYRTHSIKYSDVHGNDTSYLFPISIYCYEGNLYIEMTYGSVDRHFQLPDISNFLFNYDDIKNSLTTISLSDQMYKLLVQKQTIIKACTNKYNIFVEWGMFMKPIYKLDAIGFPFMRITNNNMLKK